MQMEQAIAGYRSIAVAVCDQQLTVVGAIVYHTYVARLFTAQRPPHIGEYAEEKRTKQNLFVRSGTGKYDAKVTNNSRLHSTYRYCTIEATDTSLARPLCDSRTTYAGRSLDAKIFSLFFVLVLTLSRPDDP